MARSYSIWKELRGLQALRSGVRYTSYKNMHGDASAIECNVHKLVRSNLLAPGAACPLSS